MKKHYILLLIIPVCFIVLSINLRSAEGPYYYGSADPSYVYLFNSMIIAQSNSSGIGHIDHPGTPLQIAGAIVIKIFYLLSHEKNDISEDVIFRPEAYLRAINFVLIFLNGIGLYLMGIIIYSVNKNIWVSLLFQTIPFISINVTSVFPLVKTESFIFFISCILISLMFKFVYDPPDKPNSYIIIIGILSGFILATKISFLCLLMLPLILFPGLRNKLIFVLITILSFTVFVLPVISNTGYFINWVGGLIFNDGRYGKGNPSILNFQTFTDNALKIFINEKFFAAVYFISLLIMILSLFSKKDTGSEKNLKSPELKFLFALFAAMSLQIVFVSKHYSQRYMYPALILSIPALFIIVNLLYKKYFSKINYNFVFGTVLIFTLLFGAYNYRKQLARTKMKSNETEKLNNFIKDNYQNSDIVLSSGTSNEYVGLILGYFYSGENVKQNFSKVISERYPGVVWFDIFGNSIFSISGSGDIKNILRKDRPVLYQTMDESYNDEFINNLKEKYGIKNVRLTKVYSSGTGETLFELAE